MSEKCWEVKRCPFHGASPEDSKCGAYKMQVGCWEYDWAGFYSQMPECKEKAEWREVMLDGCLKCEVYGLHRREEE